MTKRFTCLLSFHYYGNREMTSFLDEHLFMDSGAFSALTQGAPIDVHDYAKFLVKYAHEFQLMASLDVIGHDADSAEASWRNFRILREDYGLDVLPVMHVGEPFAMLDRYLDSGEPYIALGGLVATPWKVAAPWTVQAFIRAQGRAVFHGFGVSSWRSLMALPWYSVDHTSWQSGVVHSSLVLFNGRSQKAFRVGKHMNTAASREFNDLARWYGIDPAEVRVLRTRPDIFKVVRLAALSTERAEAFLRARHGPVHHPTLPDAPTGLRVYLATGQHLYLPAARDARREHPDNAVTQGRHPR